MPYPVVLQEVGPRDGLQNEPGYLSTEKKIELVNRLTDCGFQRIEVTSFVHPKWIPALADALEVLSGITRKKGVEYSALVPNERGLERALRANVDAVSVFMSASETHNQRNINKSILDTYPVLEPVVSGAKDAGLRVRGYVSTAFACPYEGAVDPIQVIEICKRLLALGVDEISIGDTIGVAVPTQVTSLLAMLEPVLPLHRIALHFHDTRGTAIANVMAGWLAGVRVFDASIGGLGGCPYAPGATGNVATDDVLYLFDKMGISTGVESEKVAQTAAWLEQALGKSLPSHARAVAHSQEGDG